MNRYTVILALCICFACAGNSLAFDFSADVVTTGGGRTMTGKMAASKDKMRMDMAGTTTITRMDKNVTWLIMPGQNVYMEQPVDPESIAGFTEKVTGEIERVLVGTESVSGRAAKKYRIVYVSGNKRGVVFQWIDVSSGIPVKASDEDGSWSTELRNLRVGSPPDSVFEVPSGYKKIAIPGMNEAMQHTKRDY